MEIGQGRKRGINWMSTPAIGGLIVAVMMVACLASLPYTLSRESADKPVRYDHHRTKDHHQPPLKLKDEDGREFEKVSWMGRDRLGRSMAVRCLLGGAISLGIGLAAAAISVSIGTMWGLVAGYLGGRVDSTMMRIVDVLYGLPYILLVILLAVAADGLVSNYKLSVNERLEEDAYAQQRADYEAAKAEAIEAQARYEAIAPDDPGRASAQQEAERLQRAADQLDPHPWLYRFVNNQQWLFDLAILFVAIGAVSWLTLARVVRGQVLSIKSQPFIEAARAAGVPTWRVLTRHVLPNLIGPIIVYTTLTVPQAILQESFLSFLGIGVKPPLPSWGNLAAEGLSELNPVKGHWWLLVWPCVLLGVTLLALNFLGDGLRDRFDPRHRQA